MKRPRINWSDVILYSVVIGVTMGVLYYDFHTGRLRMWRTAHIMCQRTARIIGQWGIEAERRYLSLVEKNRTI